MREIAILLSVLLFSTNANAESQSEKQNRLNQQANFLGTQEGFLYWAGAMEFQSSTCKAPRPEAMIDALARRAGVTREEMARQGAGSPFAEGYLSAKRQMKMSGQSKMCATYNASMAAARAKGLF